MTHYPIYELGDVELQSGETLVDARIAYQTYGTLNSQRSNVVVIPTFYTGTHFRNESYFGPARAVDPARHSFQRSRLGDSKFKRDFTKLIGDYGSQAAVGISVR